ncbi:hypothetical protein DTL42_16395 [Bremerella cremea]|uniref:DUF4412 domain-containing protein n=1 Tax=Bremerella cremea TaxID=1031537 RepID=A0A368KNM8_9BACT|nr:hypothetical protein [Bremerella cremea]RCS46067.1 hypothetical protein DTL42_16395 [Bremerella cremea]
MKTTLLVTAVLFTWVSLASLNHAADFQVSTRLYEGNNPNPAITLETIFKGEKVYDVITTAPRQVTIIDFEAGLVTLLDPQRQVKVTLRTQEILENSAYFKTKGNFPDNPLWNFLRDPEFSTQYDPQMKLLKMEGGPITYEVDLDLIDQQPLADTYSRFCDWAAQLNFVTGIGGLPQARMELNNQIGSKGAVPREVRKTVRYSDPAKSSFARSTHDYQWKSTPQGNALIQSIETDLKKAKAVSFEEYVKPVFAK